MNHRHILFSYRLYFGHNLYFDGHGSSHQQARINCAQHALNFIHQNETSNIIPTIEVIVFISKRKKQIKLFFFVLLDSTKI